MGPRLKRRDVALHACVRVVFVYATRHAVAPSLQVRDLQNSFFNQLTSVAMTVFEKYNQENSDIESLPEEARTLLQVSRAVALPVRTGRYPGCPS